MYIRIFILCFLASFLSKIGQAQECRIRGMMPGIEEVTVIHQGASFLDKVIDTVSIDSDGSFLYEVPLKHGPRKVYLKFSDKEWVVWASELQDITFQVGKNGQPLFFGGTKEIQHYLLNKDNQWSEIYRSFQRNDLFHHLSKPHSNEYFTVQDEITASRIEYLERSVSKGNSNTTVFDDFIRRETQDLIFLDLYYKVNYGDAQINKFKFVSEEKDSDGRFYYRYTEKNPFNDREALTSQSFLQFANMFFMQVAIKSLRKESLAGQRGRYIERVFEAIDSITYDKYCSQIHKIFFLADELKDLTYNGSESDMTPQMFSKYLALVKGYPPTDKEIMSLQLLFEEKYNELRKLSTVSIANYVLFDESGKDFNFASVKGQLIYIDVWASWCGPCLESIDSWNTLVRKWGGNKKISFIMISIDSNVDKWKNALVEYQPSALQLISPGDFEKSDFAKKLGIEMLPAYAIVDKDGKVISTKAPRPDSIQLSSFLELYSR